MKYTIGVDLGTTNLCALLVNSENYKLEHMVSVKNDTLLPSVDSACFEQDPEIIIDKTICLLKELVLAADIDVEQISGIAITGQMHGVLLVDDQLKPQTPLYTWRDRRAETSGLLENLLQNLPEEYLEITGCRLATGFGGATLAWLLNNAECRERLVSLKAVSIADYLSSVLTGVVCTDYSNAAGWGIFDIKNNCWSEDMLEALGIPVAMLPDIVASGVSLGTILPEIMEKTSLGSKTKVWVPIGDNQASFYGATRGMKNEAVINVGTSGQITLPSTEICTENGIETRPKPGGGYLLVGATLCGGWSYEYLARFFGSVIQKLAGIDMPREQLYANMKELLNSSSENKGSGLEVITKFSGTRSGIGVQTGSIIGINEGNFTPENLIYGFLQGIVQELATMLPRHKNQEDCWDVLVATGNAIRLNPATLAIIEDVFDKRCEMSVVTEEAASGAAFVAINLGE